MKKAWSLPLINMN